MTDDGPAGSDWFESVFAAQRVMVILRGFPPARTVELCTRAWDAGIAQVEVPVQSPDALPSLRAAIAAGRERDRGVGAGTVTTVQQLAEVAAAGVAFTVAPGLDDEVVRWSTERELPHLPGVSTPSEIQRAVRLGLTWVKAFPATVLGPSWFTAVRAPFPLVRLVATGGISAENAPAFLHAGARVVSLGSAVADPRQLEAVRSLIDRA
ncbi:bifunctional 4-hydroxy-2-oxoglutarate aldolase/2-dehydro-3-deoxy-phosphogluconate aldolase [Cellulomonas fimi]|uniref:Bifunctional 4-hydroxy-2-oxoglutarate aldolase/2-dehydro-3-deoxy-phosphogluconate aldolase n=1 Tax=Cellulomonas fimi TaxID=1708 RepID=A0A7Y0LZW1_CELFI|nr:bifunctional 4-hydroxy-2-oxoglutarate aldolase/2-dehydro-3-deoxy-phosphogluconate aldolase [Cellulomonas fimi]NMR21263.1 bifunctional 4-hydroxy-2-oxoglutarate aldolase/2-dehydro-3-deoxy-phosphogluconate aldolase [Cellulomonas fimi]